MGRTIGGDRDPEIEQRLRRLALSVVADLPPDAEHAGRVLDYSRELLVNFVLRPEALACDGAEAKPPAAIGRAVLSIVP